MVLDQRGRPLRDLRISVTDSCNFRCTYCMPAADFPADFPFLKASQLLSFQEIVHVVEAALPLGLKKVKLTGGEPLLRSLLPELVLTLKHRFPDLEVGLITNGLHLTPLLPRLASAGLDSVTVSIDALDPETFGTLTGNGHRVETILEAIEAAHRTFGAVKLNTVLLRGENDDQIEPLARHFRRPGFSLRFIEFMDVGTLNRWSRDRVVPGDEVLKRLEELGPLERLTKKHPGETSDNWAWADRNGSVGFINSVTRPFCGDCSRVRLGADGQLYTCLFSAKGYDLRALLRSGASVEDISAHIRTIWTGRSDRYSEIRSDLRVKKVEMFAVGGDDVLSHVDAKGLPTMVDVGEKPATRRTAVARALVDFPSGVMEQLQSAAAGSDLVGSKGPIFATAVVAGVQAAKKTWELIPMCHPLPLDGIQISCSVVPDHQVEVLCTVKTTHKTGVEMEALTGATVAALTIYDMTKALSHAIVIRSIELLKKTGGKSDSRNDSHAP